MPPNCSERLGAERSGQRDDRFWWTTDGLCSLETLQIRGTMAWSKVPEFGDAWCILEERSYSLIEDIQKTVNFVLLTVEYKYSMILNNGWVLSYFYHSL